jgi:hypothetical protein
MPPVHFVVDEAKGCIEIIGEKGTLYTICKSPEIKMFSNIINYFKTANDIIENYKNHGLTYIHMTRKDGTNINDYPHPHLFHSKQTDQTE